MWGRRRGVNLIDTPEMEGFFEQLDHLNEAQLLGLRAAWQAISPAAHQDAWAAVRAVGVAEGLTKEIDRVRNKALGWASRGTNVAPYTLSDPITWQQTKLEAGEAIVDAALAVALGGRLDAGQREVLIAPWLRATEV
jgi:hypothetical protein